MNSFLTLWIVLVVLIAISMVLMAGASEGFSNYSFIPGTYYGWGGGPPPWRGWKNRWGWGWPLWGEGRYGWGSSWGYDPRKYYNTYTEPFASGSEESVPTKKVDEALLEYPPNGPSKYTRQVQEPYLLLNDEFPPEGPPDKISEVNSRSCYATDFSRLLEPPSYRQMTNNYKHGYPDSCSSPFQELVNSFYKNDGMRIDVPKNCL